jgi:hypothetical protein
LGKLHFLVAGPIGCDESGARWMQESSLTMWNDAVGREKIEAGTDTIPIKETD